MVVLVRTFAYKGVLIKMEHFAQDFVHQSNAKKTKYTVKFPQILSMDVHNLLSVSLKNLMRISISVQFSNVLYYV